MSFCAALDVVDENVKDIHSEITQIEIGDVWCSGEMMGLLREKPGFESR